MNVNLLLELLSSIFEWEAIFVFMEVCYSYHKISGNLYAGNISYVTLKATTV